MHRFEDVTISSSGHHRLVLVLMEDKNTERARAYVNLLELEQLPRAWWLPFQHLDEPAPDTTDVVAPELHDEKHRSKKKKKKKRKKRKAQGMQKPTNPKAQGTRYSEIHEPQGARHSETHEPQGTRHKRNNSRVFRKPANCKAQGMRHKRLETRESQSTQRKAQGIQRFTNSRRNAQEAQEAQ